MSDDELEKRGEEPPVVARLVIEIRSDGSHTIARGAIEDSARGDRVAIEAVGSTPLALAAALARQMVKGLTSNAISRALLRGRRPR